MVHTNRTLILLVLLALLLSACRPVQPPVTSSEPAAVPAAQAPAPQPYQPRPDAPPYAVRGPYAVGVRDFVFETLDRQIAASVWYPALNPDAQPEAITYTLDFPTNEFPAFTIAGRALRNAQPDMSAAPYPLVVHIHGAWSFRQEAVYLAEQLASRGFVVIAPALEDNWGVLFGVFPTHEISRPRDASLTIDFAADLTTPGGALAGLINMEHVAATGWSWGAQVALELAGARLNLDEWQAEFCPNFPDDRYCSEYPAHIEEMAAVAGLDTVPKGLWPDWRDSRIDVVAPLAPDVSMLGGGGLDGVEIPVMILVGSADSSVGPGLAFRKGYENLPSPAKARVTFDNADHILFMNNCTAQPGMAASGYASVCSDAVWDMDRAHDLVNHFVTAFLLAELKGDTAAAAALAPENVSFPGIQYETTGYGAAVEPPAAAAPEPALDEATAAKIDAIVQKAMADNPIPGFQMCVVKDRQVVYNKGFGLADVAAGRPMTPQSVIIQASISKSMTAMAVLRLVEQGKIDLDARVTDYLPDFTMADGRYQDITVHMLLSHRSGLPDTESYWDTPLDPTLDPLEQTLRWIADQQLLFAPGTDWAYSDKNYAALGAIIATVTGMQYETYMQEEWLNPLGMAHSTYVLGDVDPARRVAIYGSDAEGKAAETTSPCDERDAPACTLASSCEDMVKWAQFLLNKGEVNGVRLLQPASIDAMWASQSTTPWLAVLGDYYGSLLEGYGLGWYVGEKDGHRLIGHTGGITGANTQLQLAPDDGMAVIAMDNWDDEDAPAYPASFAGFDVLYLLLGIEPQ